MPKGKLKAKGTVPQGTQVEEPKGTDHQFLCTKEVGTPKASFNRGIILSLLKACKLKTGWKKTKGKLQASERQAKSKLKGS